MQTQKEQEMELELQDQIQVQMSVPIRIYRVQLPRMLCSVSCDDAGEERCGSHGARLLLQRTCAAPSCAQEAGGAGHGSATGGDDSLCSVSVQWQDCGQPLCGLSVRQACTGRGRSLCVCMCWDDCKACLLQPKLE
jgi:hypothetical protein